MGNVKARGEVLLAAALSRCIRDAWREVTGGPLTTTRDLGLLETFIALGGRASMRQLRQATGLSRNDLKHSLKKMGCQTEPLHEGGSAPVRGLGVGANLPSCEGKFAPVWGKNAPMIWVLPQFDLLVKYIENKILTILLRAGIPVEGGKFALPASTSLFLFKNLKEEEEENITSPWGGHSSSRENRKTKLPLAKGSSPGPLGGWVPLLSCVRLVNGCPPKGNDHKGAWVRQKKNPELALEEEQALVGAMNPAYLRHHLDPWERQEAFSEALDKTYRVLFGKGLPQVEAAKHPEGEQWGNAVLARRAADSAGALYEPWIREAVEWFRQANMDQKRGGCSHPDPGHLKGAPALKAYQAWEGLEGAHKSHPERYFGEPAYSPDEFNPADEIQQEYFRRVHERALAIGRPIGAEARALECGGRVDRQCQLIHTLEAKNYIPKGYTPDMWPPLNQAQEQKGAIGIIEVGVGTTAGRPRQAAKKVAVKTSIKMPAKVVEVER